MDVICYKTTCPNSDGVRGCKLKQIHIGDFGLCLNGEIDSRRIILDRVNHPDQDEYETAPPLNSTLVK